ncbi:hypothetical protein HY857_02510 [Candidatus Saccharibacteria bacterium]|nr:hypothetical protein [Candidatus Saccharibacteria bacterium]
MKKLKDNLIIKAGSDVLWGENGQTQNSHRNFQVIGKQLIDLPERKVNPLDPIFVTSGGIRAGMSRVGLEDRPSKTTQMPELQRLACIGWLHLLSIWDRHLEERVIGGMLLTRRELDENTREREEALKTIYTMLYHGDLPIINENDAVTHEEIAFGDNDLLAASLGVAIKESSMFGRLVGLVVLSTSPGLCIDKRDPSTRVARVNDVDLVRHLVDDDSREISNGGMNSKLAAAELLTNAGIDMWVANGWEEDAIQRAMNGEIGTHFVAKPQDNVE